MLANRFGSSHTICMQLYCSYNLISSQPPQGGAFARIARKASDMVCRVGFVAPLFLNDFLTPGLL
jgi:hypothetical protein